MDVKSIEWALGRELTEVERERVAQGGDPDSSPTWYEEQIWVDPQRHFLDVVFAAIPEVEEELLDSLRAPIGDAREKALGAWQKRWNLTADWCLTKNVYCDDDPDDPWSPAPIFTFSVEGWDPRRYSSEKRAKERMREAFEQALDARFAAAEERLRERGWLDPQQSRNPAHFVWAARWQCGPEEYEDIARWQTEHDDPVTKSGVGREVRKVLHRIGLKRRRPASKGGRPRGKKPRS